MLRIHFISKSRVVISEDTNPLLAKIAEKADFANKTESGLKNPT